MAKQNQFKNTGKSNDRSSGKPKVNLTFLPKFQWKGKRSRKILGLSLLLLSAFFAISFTSFLFTWKADQSVLSSDWQTFFFDAQFVAENWLGKVGAWISHTFIYSSFGISAFLFIPLLFLMGVKLLFKITLLPLGKSWAYSLFLLVFGAIGLGYFFDNQFLYLGGALGFHGNKWLQSVFGNAGTALLLFFTATTFIIQVFDPSFHQIKKWWQLIFPNRSSTEEENEQEEEIAENRFVQKTDTETEVSSETSAAIDLDTSPSKEEEEKEKQKEDMAAPEVEDGKKEEDLEAIKALESEEFSVEIAAAEETTLSEKQINDKLKEFGEYDPKLDLASYKLPPIDLLEEHLKGDKEGQSVSKEELEANKDKIVTTLGNYNIKIAKIKATIGPTVTLYEIIPEAGVRISKIKNLEDDIALSLAALGIRIIAPIPGKGTIGIEVPNSNPDIVAMRTLLASDKFQNSKMELPIALGKTISNESYVADLSRMPHLLMAGATGQGKSVGLNAILVSLLYKKHPSQIKFVLVDPKKVELTLFNKIERHFLAKLPDAGEAIITDTKKVIHTLQSLCIEMDQRYELLKDAQVRNIKEYNSKFISRRLNPEKGHRYLPYIVLVIDEFADLILTAGKEVETPIARLAQLARAIGIHLIIATQRPSVNIITGTIKANFPARIAFRVTSKIDSRTILDAGGADQLIGRGDLLLSTGNDIIRIQCGFVDTPEVDKITEFIGAQRGYAEAFLLPEYVDESAESGGLDDGDRDDLFEEAAKIIVTHQQGSASLLQRKLKLGYNRAGRIVDQLEAAGIIGPFEGSKARKVLISDEQSLEQFLSSSQENGDALG